MELVVAEAVGEKKSVSVSLSRLEGVPEVPSSTPGSSISVMPVVLAPDALKRTWGEG